MFSYECVCGKKFKSNKGLKIHQHKCPSKDRIEQNIIRSDVNQERATTEDVSEMTITQPILETSISEPISEHISDKESVSAPVFHNQERATTEDVSEMTITEPILETSISEPISEHMSDKESVSAPVFHNQERTSTEDVSEMTITEPILETSVSEPISEHISDKESVSEPVFHNQEKDTSMSPETESPKEIVEKEQEILVKVPKNVIATSSEPLHLDLSISIPNIDIVIRDLRMVAEFQVKAMQRLERLDSDRDLLNKIKTDMATYSENMINQQQKIQVLMIILAVGLVVFAFWLFKTIL